MTRSTEEGQSLSRRRVVQTGVKVAYAAPIVAATVHLASLRAGAASNCACQPAAGNYVFDETPPLDGDSNPSGFVPACCTCVHCVQLGAPNPSYDPVTNSCLSDGQPTDRCYPLCTDVCEVVSP
jgi:hypothetical protein